MRGEFLGVQSEIIAELFQPLGDGDELDQGFYMDLFRDSIPSPVEPRDPEPSDLDENGEIYLPGDIEADAAYRAAFERFQDRLEAYANASSDEGKAWIYFAEFFADQDTTEAQIVRALENAFDVFQEYGGDELSNEYFLTVQRFLEKYSLRYDLRRPFSLHPTLPGIFSKLIRELKAAAIADEALAGLMNDFEDSVRDLRDNKSDRRMRQCIEAQFKLIEAFAQRYPGINPDSLGQMCHHLPTWPHQTVRAAIGNLYGFASNYPGIRHAGNPASKIRDIEMRDLVSMSIVLAGFTPYLTDLIDTDRIYSD
ncbi:predicted protein (plasmid) [Ruegeria sp. TM1040]|uniref:hypothetical protein n=1 Tax=Ruegeria sp. (strain TM1040) TaxID=292414 RepID=UPI0000557B87|nr:hypothetical protein [Ruegeria sp. TM1040]ABF62510.1 predicted protein [Ruegeria sp. TM1040]